MEKDALLNATMPQEIKAPVDGRHWRLLLR
jgi:hypothetical protein